jgi:hypothetical protein
VPYDEHTPEGFDSVITMGFGSRVQGARGRGKRNKGNDLLWLDSNPGTPIGGGDGEVLETTIPHYRSDSYYNLLIHMASESE